MFITFEGIDQSGKSTQAVMLADRLRKDGHTVVCLREPGGTPLSERIRTLLLEKDQLAINPVAELLLFSSARSQLVNEVILPALLAGCAVVCDRFYDSTTAYQGYGRGLNLSDVQALNRVATVGIIPDLTFLVSVSLDVVARRRAMRGQEADRMESSGHTFYERVSAGYEEIAAREPGRFVIIDGSLAPEEIHDRIWQVIQQRFT